MQIARLKSGPEIFYSLQGEGASVGTPAVFLRLCGCNLRCAWCDTKYSWATGLNCTVEEIAQQLNNYPCRRLIITGGEPLLQEDELIELLALLPEWDVEIESNGTLWPSRALRERVMQWNISPKLRHSGEEHALIPSTLQQFATLSEVWFKFVVCTHGDWEQIAALELPRHRIIIMPCATSRDELRKQRMALVELCLREGVRLGDRLHLELWDKKKGV